MPLQAQRKSYVTTALRGPGCVKAVSVLVTVNIEGTSAFQAVGKESRKAVLVHIPPATRLG